MKLQFPLYPENHSEAIEINIKNHSPVLVFPNEQNGKALPDLPFSKLAKELGYKVIVHSFYTTLRT